MKRLLIIMMAVALVFSGTVFSVENTDKVTVTLDGNEIIFPDAQPFIDSRDRTLVPIRFVSEALGAEVSWEDETQTVTIVKGKDTIVYTIGNLGASLNGVKYAFDTIGILKEDRTFVPLRFISELLNCKVDWLQESVTVVITSPAPPVAFPEPVVTVNYPNDEYSGKLFWITLDNMRDYSDCNNYQFKIDFITPVEFNMFEQDEGAINGWQTYDRNQWFKLGVKNTTVFSVSSEHYTTRANKEKLKLYEGMPLNFKLSVQRKCSGEVREYSYTETFKYPYPEK